MKNQAYEAASGQDENQELRQRFRSLRVRTTASCRLGRLDGRLSSEPDRMNRTDGELPLGAFAVRLSTKLRVRKSVLETVVSYCFGWVGDVFHLSFFVFRVLPSPLTPYSLLHAERSLGGVLELTVPSSAPNSRKAYKLLLECSRTDLRTLIIQPIGLLGSCPPINVTSSSVSGSGAEEKKSMTFETTK